MDTSSLKTTAFGGYSKKSVHDFLSELSLTHSVKLSGLSEEKGELTDKIIELEKKIASLEETIGASEEEKDHVANAIVSAEKEAAKILANASREAEEILLNAKKEADEISAKAHFNSETLKANTKADLKDEFDKIKDLRISTFQAMSAYKDKLDAIAKRLGADE